MINFNLFLVNWFGLYRNLLWRWRCLFRLQPIIFNSYCTEIECLHRIEFGEAGKNKNLLFQTSAFAVKQTRKLISLSLCNWTFKGMHSTMSFIHSRVWQKNRQLSNLTFNLYFFLFRALIHSKNRINRIPCLLLKMTLKLHYCDDEINCLASIQK